MKKTFFSRILESRTLIVVEVCVVIFLVVVIGKEIIRRQDVQSEVTRLQQQIDHLKQQNIELAQVLKEMTSENYQEKQARSKLDVQKPGETVVLLPEATTDGSRSLVVQTSSSAISNNNTHTNAEKWWSYFFGVHNS